MKLTHFHLEHICKEIQKELPCRINKIRKGFKKEILLELYKEGFRKTLVIGLNPNQNTFHLADKAKTFSFSADSFVGFLRKYLNRKFLVQMECLNNERVIYLIFEDAPLLIAHVFPKSGNLFVVDPESQRILTALNRVSEKHYEELEKKLLAEENSPTLKEPKSYPLMQEIAEEHYQNLKTHIHQIFSKQQSKDLKLKIKKLKRKILNIEKDFNNCKQAQKFSNWGNILLSYHANDKRKGLNSIETYDFEGNSINIELDPKLSVQQNSQKYFSKSRKMKKAFPILEKRLLDEKKNLKALQGQEIKQYSMDELKTLLESQKNKKQKTWEKELLAYENPEGVRFYVGRNSDENDLIYKMARGRDYWFHNRDYPGSHILIRVERGERPNEKDIATACQLAILYSKSRKNEEGYVMMSRRKFLSKTPGMPAGKVNISRYKSYFFKIDQENISKLSKIKE